MAFPDTTERHLPYTPPAKVADPPLPGWKKKGAALCSRGSKLEIGVPAGARLQGPDRSSLQSLLQLPAFSFQAAKSVACRKKSCETKPKTPLALSSMGSRPENEPNQTQRSNR